MRSTIIRLHQRLTPVLVLLPLLLVGCEQGGPSDHPGTPQGKRESPLATSSGASVNEEFVRLAETAMAPTPITPLAPPAPTQPGNPAAPGGPSLGLSPHRLTFTAALDGLVNPQDVSLSVPGDVGWSVSSSSEWITVVPRSGRGPATLRVAVAAPAGAPGLYPGVVQIHASGVVDSPQILDVTLVVSSHPGARPGSTWWRRGA